MGSDRNLLAGDVPLMMKVKIYDLNDRLVFAGMVEEEAVEITGGSNRPTTARIKLPIEDILSKLYERPWDNPEHDVVADIREMFKPLVPTTWRATHGGHCHPRCYDHDADGECLITDD